MKYAIISDIHSNLESLEEVLREIDERGAERVVCLGDIVGYNANPNECIELVRERNIACIMGNHDAAASSLESLDYFNYAARSALIWTNRQLRERNRRFLAGLPEQKMIDSDFLMVHGSPLDRDTYLLSHYEALGQFPYLEERGVNSCFFGHSHRPVLYSYDSEVVGEGLECHQLKKETYYLINPGSVGQPRDGDPRASFLLFDSDTFQIEVIRLDYDVNKTAKKVFAAGLDPILGERLYLGI